MRIKSVLLSLSAIAALSASVANASTNLITNGDFSQTSNGNNNQVGHVAGVAGETMLNGWTSYDGNNGGYNFVLNSSQITTNASRISLQTFSGLSNGGNFFASDAQYHPGVLSQTINGLTAGDSYTLTFNYALGQQSGYTGANTDNYWRVLFGQSATEKDFAAGATLTNTSAQNAAGLSIAQGGFSGWQTASMTFTAQNATQVLSFLAQGSPGAPPFLLLDNVSLAAVPEPTTWAMMLGGIGLMGFVARRRAAKRA